MPLHKKGIPLQLLIGTAIFSAMFILSLILMIQSYQSNKQALLMATAETAQQLSQTINERTKRITGPAQSALQILSHDPLLQAKTLTQRTARLPVLVETLKSNDVLSAIYAGYTNGEFFLIRKLNPLLKDKYQVPESAEYMLQTITERNGKRVGEWSYYDHQLQLLLKQEKPDYQYNPRTRGWYVDAKQTQAQVLTPPYLFYTTKEIGITLAMQAHVGHNVIGMDASVADLSAQLANLRLTSNTELAVIDNSKKVLAYTDTERMLVQEGDSYRLSSIEQLNVEPLTILANLEQAPYIIKPVNTIEQDWFALWLPVNSFAETDIRVLVAVPEGELLAGAKEVIYDQIAWAVLLIFLMLMIGMYSATMIGRSFKQLTRQVRALTNFDFNQAIEIKSSIREAKELSQVVDSMSSTIHNFQLISSTLNREPNLENMLDGVLKHLVSATGMQDGAIYLYRSEQQDFELASQTKNDVFPAILKHYAKDDQKLIELTLGQLENSTQYLVTPLRKRDNQLEGLLIVQGSGRALKKDHLQHFIAQLSGSAAVAIETRRLIDGQKAMIEGILRLLADAIDAKSPYTSGHCERVPELAVDLVQTLGRANTGPYADFKMNEQEQEAFRIAAWMHDCGKILSQEHVIDKATKLETIYNRIHEIRTRFEVLWRDAEIDFWQQLHQGGDKKSLEEKLRQTQRQLQEEFTFIAQINEGAIPTHEEQCKRIDAIGERTWLRHFDNRIGLSQDELDLLTGIAALPLPATEKLLANRPEHIINWKPGRKPPVTPDDPNNRWQFNMQRPEYSFNFGERYNLSIRFGTLTEEERFKINEHIVHTIMMLDALPLPEHLKKVPQIAGNHHERIDGKGYPRGLTGEQMSTPEKVMAIADIFEALTASDRPYKKPKSISQALNIMTNMAQGGHIDPVLFANLLKTDVFMAYGQNHLQTDQLDQVKTDELIQQLSAIPEPA